MVWGGFFESHICFQNTIFKTNLNFVGKVINISKHLCLILCFNAYSEDLFLAQKYVKHYVLYIYNLDKQQIEKKNKFK